MRVWTRAWVRVERAGAPAVWWLEDFESASLDHHKISLDRKQKRDRKRSRMAGPKMVSPGETKNGPAWRDRKRSRLARPKMVPPGGTAKRNRIGNHVAIPFFGPARRDHFWSRQAGSFSIPFLLSIKPFSVLARTKFCDGRACQLDHPPRPAAAHREQRCKRQSHPSAGPHTHTATVRGTDGPPLSTPLCLYQAPHSNPDTLIHVTAHAHTPFEHPTLPHFCSSVKRLADP